MFDGDDLCPRFADIIRNMPDAPTDKDLPKMVSQQTGRIYRPAKHTINKMLARRMNPPTIPFVFSETFYHHAILWGNGFGLITRQPGTFSATGMYNLDPEKVTPFRLSGQPFYFVRDAQGPGQDASILAADIVHVPGLGFDGLQGYPLV